MILQGDCFQKLSELSDDSVHCCVTSPPYWGLRDYGVEGQLGLEKTPEEYVAKMVEVFREVRRVLRNDGTLWLNLGDSYAQGGSGGCSPKSTLTGGGGRYREGSKLEAMTSHTTARKPPLGLKPKDLVGIPWRVAFALQADGWYLRQDIIWHKPNPMPESVRDRCTKAHEYIFLLSKSPKYYFDTQSILEPFSDREFRGKLKGERGSQPYAKVRGNDRTHSGGYPRTRDGRNKRSVWTVTTKPFKGAHFATFPPDLIEPCVLAGCPEGGTVLDPFFGAGTVGLVAQKHKRKFIGIELNQEYVEIANKRIYHALPLFKKQIYSGGEK
jgi:DNA modification methylase